MSTEKLHVSAGIVLVVLLARAWATVPDPDPPPGLDVAKHYYTYIDQSISDGPAVIEIWSDPTTAPVIPAGWSEVTLEQLHFDSILSPSEVVAAVVASTEAQNGTSDPVIETDGGHCRSYVYVQRIHNRWQVTLGSETWRDWTTPGWLWTFGESRQQENLYFSATTRDQWGYKSCVQAPPKFEVQSWWYRQDGGHAFNTPHQPTYRTNATGVYP